jgi:predicted DNA-binding transcriptional regulator YafY
MYSPATRLLTALDLLQSRPLVSATHLAQRLEVDPRSVRRYITMLADMGIPVESARGKYGGYRIMPGFKLPPLMLTEDEAITVTLGLLAVRRLGLADDLPTADGALGKLQRVLPAALRERVRAVEQSVALGLDPPATTTPAARLSVFSTAAYQQRRLWLRYQSSSSGETERELDPYGVAYHDGRWYAVGYCHLRHEVRVFRLDRVLRVEPRDAHFTRPEGFDALGFALRAFAAIPDTWLVEVLLDTTMDAVRWSVPPAFATLDETPEGVLLRTYDRDLDHTARFLIGLDCRLRVRQPSELLTALHRAAQTIAERVAHADDAKIAKTM